MVEVVGMMIVVVVVGEKVAVIMAVMVAAGSVG